MKHFLASLLIASVATSTHASIICEDRSGFELDGETVSFTFDEAQLIADAIKDCLAGKNEGEKIAINGSFSVHGRGNAIAVAAPESAAPKMFTRDLALEFAELLERETAKSKT